MSDPIYAAMQRVIAQQLKRFGTPRVTQRITSNFDPVTSTDTESVTEIVRNGLLTDVKAVLVSEVRMVGNSNILTTDKVVIFGADGHTTEKDRIVLDGYEWSVFKIFPIIPGGVPLLYKVVVRR